MKSDDPRDELRAALNHDHPDADQDLSAEYLAACREWHDAMASRDKAMAAATRDAFDKGNKKSAELIAVVLAPAPRFPLS
jgi:hypothetical protein